MLDRCNGYVSTSITLFRIDGTLPLAKRLSRLVCINNRFCSNELASVPLEAFRVIVLHACLCLAKDVTSIEDSLSSHKIISIPIISYYFRDGSTNQYTISWDVTYSKQEWSFFFHHLFQLAKPMPLLTTLTWNFFIAFLGQAVFYWALQSEQMQCSPRPKVLDQNAALLSKLELKCLRRASRDRDDSYTRYAQQRSLKELISSQDLHDRGRSLSSILIFHPEKHQKASIVMSSLTKLILSLTT